VLQEEEITNKLHVLWFGGADDYVINTQMMVVFFIGKLGEEDTNDGSFLHWKTWGGGGGGGHACMNE
jgi:hypothetical protein